MAYIKKERKISVIMGIYNCQDTLVESIESIILQTYTDWELIICDDFSNDSSYKIAKKYADKYDNILLLQNDKNIGLAATLNKCLLHATSEFIARQDGDDISLPHRFQQQINFLLNNHEYALVSSTMNFFNKYGVYGKSTLNEIPNKNDFINGSPFSHAPSMIRLKVLKEVEFYTVNKLLKRGQDYFLWYKIYKKGYIGYNFTEPLYNMRKEKNSLNRISFIDRVYGMIIHAKVIYGLKLPFYSYIHIFKTFIIWALPTCIYNILFKLKYHNKNDQ